MNNFQKKYKDNFLLCMFFDISMTPALMIYSWILPAIHQPQEMKWVKIDGKGQYKKFASLHICLTGETIKQMFDFITYGSSLNEACKKLKIPEIKGSSTHIKISEWRLSLNAYANRAPVIYKEQPSISGQESSYFYSPTKESIAEVEALFCLNKEQYFAHENILAICQFLQNKTGIEFNSSQFSRLGNIEWFETPCSDIQDSNFVEYYVKRNPLDVKPIISGNEVVVKLHEKLSGNFFINVECQNANAIILNELKMLSTIEKRNISFMTSEEISRVKIRIWEQKDDVSKLIFQHSTWYIRSIHLSINPMSGTASIETQKTFKLKKSVKADQQKEITNRECVSLKSHHSNSIISPDCNDPWRDIILDTNDLVKVDRRFLKKTGDALFLPQGWDGSIAFMDWYQNLGRKYQDLGKVILIDPYADQEALLFLSRIGLSGVTFEILANSYVHSEPEKFRNTLPNVFTTINKKLHMLSFKYYDISDSKKLHDRYLILQNKQGGLLSGFHLSNSIQGANSEFPLLITNIPLLVLYEINEWLNKKILDKNSVELLYDSILERQKTKLKPIEADRDAFFINEEKIRNDASYDWKNICLSAHKNNETLENLRKAAANFSCQQWESILKQTKGIILQPITNENYRAEFAHYHIYDPKMPTNESYSHGIRHLQYGHFTAFEVAPEVFHFVQVAMQNAPNKLVELLDIATENYSPNNLTGTVFSATTACLFWRERVVVGSSIIQSKNQFIQGFICGQIYSELINEELSFEDAITQLACLTVDQRLIALSFWIYDLRIAINRNQMDKIKIGLTKKTFDHMRFLWTLNTSERLLDTIFETCCGPSLGNHADSTTNEFLIPLINDGKMKIENLWNYFNKIFKEKITNEHPYINSDVPVYTSVGYISQSISEEVRKNFIKNIRSSISDQRYLLNQPFIQSIDYESFNASNTRLHNILLALKCMSSNAPNIEEYKELIFNLKEYLRDRGIYLQLHQHELIQHIKDFD